MSTQPTNVTSLKSPEAPSEEPHDVLDELARLDPDVTTITLSNGMDVILKPLKTRQFLKMLRIITRGGAAAMGAIQVNADPAVFAGQLTALLVMSIPEAEDETIEFIRSMVDVSTMSKAEAETISQFLYDPELEDTVSIVEAVVKREIGDLTALGKRLREMFKVAEKVGATKPETIRSNSDLI